jgi:hypothetical protein
MIHVNTVSIFIIITFNLIMGILVNWTWEVANMTSGNINDTWSFRMEVIPEYLFDVHETGRLIRFVPDI